MDAKKTIQIIRRMRHDFGNHLQVISGYLEMGRYQDVKRYLDNIIADLAAERAAFESPHEEISLFLYEHILMARDLGIILKYQDIQIQSAETIKILLKHGEPFRTLLKNADWLRKQKAEEPVIMVCLYEKDSGIDLKFHCPEYALKHTAIAIRE